MVSKRAHVAFEMWWTVLLFEFLASRVTSKLSLVLSQNISLPVGWSYQCPHSAIWRLIHAHENEWESVDKTIAALTLQRRINLSVWNGCFCVVGETKSTRVSLFTVRWWAANLHVAVLLVNLFGSCHVQVVRLRSHSFAATLFILTTK